jgi:hypothetical protein
MVPAKRGQATFSLFEKVACPLFAPFSLFEKVAYPENDVLRWGA